MVALTIIVALTTLGIGSEIVLARLFLGVTAIPGGPIFVVTRALVLAAKAIATLSGTAKTLFAGCVAVTPNALVATYFHVATLTGLAGGLHAGSHGFWIAAVGRRLTRLGTQGVRDVNALILMLMKTI